MNEPANFGTNELTPWNWPKDLGNWSLVCPESKWDDPPYVTSEYDPFSLHKKKKKNDV